MVVSLSLHSETIYDGWPVETGLLHGSVTIIVSTQADKQS